MRDAECVTFGGGGGSGPADDGLDRAAHLRTDPAQLSALADAADARHLPLWRGKPLLDMEAGSLAFLPPRHPTLAEAAEAPVFLGLSGSQAHFASDISAWEPGEVDMAAVGGFSDHSAQSHPAAPGMAFRDLRGVMTTLAPGEASLAATARALLGWHATHRFCARCGAPSQPGQGGWVRDCPACGARHFPRTDPVAIMLVVRGNHVLLGRSPGWPEGMYSLLAGFIEPGETLETAVRREVAEEAGVQVGAVRYLTSQPWPFPASLMLGCHAEALSDEIVRDAEELEDARWVSREELAQAFRGANPLIRPGRPGAVAQFLLRHWLEDTLG
ncbi:MAG: NAD(+) diphosphatase [Rhodobacteraceae bacterium]|nr:NAD(+) diphosphatase [Paracoccaceae bacterium]